MIPFSVGSLPTSWLEDATEFVGWVYVTSDSLSNPWDSLPSYFGDMAEMLDDGSAPAPDEPEYELTVESVDQNGRAITGMWMEVKRNGATVGTGFTPLSLTLEESTYTVSAGSYQQITFDHWHDGGESSTTSVNLAANSEVTAHYKTTAPEEAILTVDSVNIDGDTVTGLWTVVKEGGATVKTGYTPLEYTGEAGSTYEVSVADYGGYDFDSWVGGSTSRTTQVTLSGDATLTARYSTGSEQVTLTVRSVALDGSPITGLWTVISGSGSATGFTPLPFTADAGSQYTVTMGEYQNYVFERWDGGSTSKSRTITPDGNTVLTAYYRQ